jgi:hypothetical protein
LRSAVSELLAKQGVRCTVTEPATIQTAESVNSVNAVVFLSSRDFKRFQSVTSALLSTSGVPKVSTR